MVIKSKIYDFLKKNLGEYLYGFQKSQLEVGLISGHIDLVNVNFRPDKVNQLLAVLGLPIQIKAGLLGKLRLKCHYTSFLTSPVEVEIDELLLVFGPLTHLAREENNLYEDENEGILQAEMEQKIINQSRIVRKNSEARPGTPKMFEEDTPRFHHYDSIDSKSQDLIKGNYGHSEDEINKKERKGKHKKGKFSMHDEENTLIKKNSNEAKKKNSEKKNGTIREKHLQNGSYKPPLSSKINFKEPEEEKKGFLEKYFSKVLKNLTLTIKGVHIRYEDETYPYLNPFTIGFSLARLEVKNVTQEWVYKDLKVLKRNPRKHAVVKEVNLQGLGVYICSMASVLIPTSLWEATIHSEIGIFEAFPAYEVRELILQESKALSSGHFSTFIEPANVNLCISFYEEAPNLRIAGVVDKVQCNFTAAMAECIRNFFDYCTNVQIWPLILRFRPYTRIPERPEKREHRKERRKRREIVRLWFQYALAFVKTKRAAIRYVKDRKKDNEHFKKMEKLEKFREKVETAKKNSHFHKQPTCEISTDVSKKSIFSSRQRKVPGSSGIKLDELVKEYNSKKVHHPVNLKRRPYDGDLYFPKFLSNSELEFSMHHINLTISDEDTRIGLELSFYDITISINTLLDEMQTCVEISGIKSNITDQSKSIEIMHAGRKPGTHTSKAIIYQRVFRPGEVLIPNDIFLNLNMYEVTCQVAGFSLNYSHNALNHFFIVKEALELDKCFRENLDFRYVKMFNSRCKKRKMPKIFGIDLKKYALCKQAGAKLVKFQENIKKHIGDLNSAIGPIMFNYHIEVQAGVLHLHDFSHSPVLEVALPNMKIEVGKDKDTSFLNVLGVSLQSENSPEALYDFLSTISSICNEKLKMIKVFTGYKGFHPQ